VRTAWRAFSVTTSRSSILCPFCQSNSTRDYCHTFDQEAEPSDVRACVECGTLFLYPQPDSTRLARAYASNYYGGNDQAKFNPWIEKLRGYFAQKRARFLTQGLPPTARILDVGCGDGRLLRTIGSRGSFELHGIELEGLAAERAATVKGIHLHLGTLSSCKLPEQSFDLVTLAHVFEHLPDPSEAITELDRLLRPSGRLFLSFPNCASWQARWFGGAWFHLDPPRHLTLVHPVALIKRLEGMGFRCIDESHLNWEQNIYGWVQSTLNKLPQKRNLLYECLKRNRPYVRGSGLSLTAHFILASLLTVLAFPIDLLAAGLHRGATIDFLFTKNSRP